MHLLKSANQPLSYLEIHNYECLTGYKGKKIKIIDGYKPCLASVCGAQFTWSIAQLDPAEFSPQCQVFLVTPLPGSRASLARGETLISHFISK